jgi:hypothetical protein
MKTVGKIGLLPNYNVMMVIRNVLMMQMLNLLAVYLIHIVGMIKLHNFLVPLMKLTV